MNQCVSTLISYLTRSNFVELETPFVCILIISLMIIPSITVFTCKEKHINSKIILQSNNPPISNNAR